jgi:hypothetical protein
MYRISSVAMLLCATLSAHGLHFRAAPRVTGTAVVFAATPVCLSRGQPPIMRAAPPAGFEWGEVDRERWFDSLPSILRWVGKPLLLLGVFSATVSLPSARGRFWRLYHAYEAAAIARPLITKSATSGVAYLLGDTIAQRRSAAGPRGVSRGRLTRATIAGAVSHGPQLHYWTVKLSLYPPSPPPTHSPLTPPGPASPRLAPPARLYLPARSAPPATVPSLPPPLRAGIPRAFRLASARQDRSRPGGPVIPSHRPAPPAPPSATARRPLAASARPRVVFKYSPSSSASSPSPSPSSSPPRSHLRPSPSPDVLRLVHQRRLLHADRGAAASPTPRHFGQGTPTHPLHPLPPTLPPPPYKPHNPAPPPGACGRAAVPRGGLALLAARARADLLSCAAAAARAMGRRARDRLGRHTLDRRRQQSAAVAVRLLVV